MSIFYPIIFRYDDMIVPVDHDLASEWGVRMLSDSEFETTESVHPEARFHWLIDGNGLFRLIELVCKAREWARPLRFVYRAVKERYSIEEGHRITVGELLATIEGTRPDRDKSLTPALQEFLEVHDKSLAFDGTMLATFLSGDFESSSGEQRT